MRSGKMKNTSLLRQELAESAAKLIAVDGIDDYMIAKKKAAMKLGVSQNKYYPSNKEIEDALITYQQLFQQDHQPQALERLRQQALHAMKLFHRLNPYLVGPVLSGTAGEHSDVILHIFSDTPEELSFILMDADIPFEECEKSARFIGRDNQYFPAFQFFADDIRIIAVVFPERKKNPGPIDPIHGETITRADLAAVEKLLY